MAMSWWTCAPRWPKAPRRPAFTAAALVLNREAPDPLGVGEQGRRQRIPVSKRRLTVSFCPLEMVTVLLACLERYVSDCARIK